MDRAVMDHAAYNYAMPTKRGPMLCPGRLQGGDAENVDKATKRGRCKVCGQAVQVYESAPGVWAPAVHNRVPPTKAKRRG